ncbi:hypothetical protein LK07_12095 [Streptomyces pluripotens]|uniref:Carboxypeptidase regulatory-like domain-containing protein n=1 Tax=Streptomyces pluripotens TaxID=1355015 RepID=A0A221NXB0_9ACTN|nr:MULTISPECIES: hypothetical protein [Streptomyces]ARP70397.1 hypothetical protein LK06_010975 [Streptomyces pluripotens]ASN24653.1 hypothetical protein LK07_12095 [Streptomyces pluripotens]KIE28230.1 membrane protein [Streptomyces sp. MUSC 125]MCH0558865.1 hypothetical protein [Streptomyces sp. MUM 16J]
MGSLRLTLCTGILAAATFAPAAHAADGGSVSVTPASPAPGADVALRVRGCTGPQGTAVSAAFVADARLTGGQGTLAGETRVRSSLRPGAYDVKITCAEYVIKGRITVVEEGAARPLEPTGVPASPVAPVHAGGGGTAHFATVAASGSGPGTAQAVTGLVLAGIAAVAVGLRARRSRGRR